MEAEPSALLQSKEIRPDHCVWQVSMAKKGQFKGSLYQRHLDSLAKDKILTQNAKVYSVAKCFGRFFCYTLLPVCEPWGKKEMFVTSHNNNILNALKI